MTTARGSDAPPPLAEQTCLALVVEGVSHGWAIGSLLAPGGDLGRIWSLSRPLTYRALESLVDQQLITRAGVEAGRGRDRSVLAATARGRRTTAAWLDQPVVHLRDIRTELLLKLTLRQRRDIPTAPLLTAQIAALEPALESLVAQATESDLIARWRSESARATRRFLEGALAAERR